MSARRFDVIVIGGGHAGSEAALAAARMGACTLLLTQSLDTLGQLSCNPSVGGIGKSHMVREIDALGGLMGRASDQAGIHFRTLNAGKGPAVRATRAQTDRNLYRAAVRAALERQPGLWLFQQPVEDLLLEGAAVRGVVTGIGLRFEAPQVILTAGTFLAGHIHIGERGYGAGRAGEAPSRPLAVRLRELRPRTGRLKTGTPPRLAAAGIDFSRLTEQPGEQPPPVFSFLGAPPGRPRQVSCHITHTNERSHDIIRAALHRSPMYASRIQGAGPRYCPSVEDKVVRFPERTAHQVFVEPEGLDAGECYPAGISTSLPFEVQQELVRSIRGFEQADITRPGYAIEYDYYDPRDLYPWLESKDLEGLFFAGQVNGTTGYEEAAAQGLMAGLNAALRARGAAPWVPERNQAYLGVLLDDLAGRGLDEPYRMFTSRAEYRLLLREDNADLRLTEQGRRLGLVDDDRWRLFERRRADLDHARRVLRETRLKPAPGVSGEALEQVLGAPPKPSATWFDLLRRPGVGCAELRRLAGALPCEMAPEALRQVEIEARYGGYIERQEREAERNRRQARLTLPTDFDYAAVTGLSHEAAQKLAQYRPVTLGQAARVPGVTPAAVSLLRVHLRRRAAMPPARRSA